MQPIVTLLLFASLALLRAETPSKPNFVVILGEGHGWSSTSVQMDDAVPGSKSSFVRTPSLEKLAQDGMRFANFYAPSPRCTPTRASLFTGKSPAQLHMTFVNEGRQDGENSLNGKLLPPPASVELPTSETTIAEVLKRAGYVTAHFGKWHMGRVSPSQHGYDENDGANNNGGPDNVANPHPKQLRNYKLIRVYETGALRLYDIAKDPGERVDLATKMPDKAKELNQRLTEYLTAVNAQMPKPNPAYDPSKPTQERRGGRRKEGK